jgi:hypothetical protein
MLSVSKDPEGFFALEVIPGGAWPLYRTPFDTDMITDQMLSNALDIQKEQDENPSKTEKGGSGRA